MKMRFSVRISLLVTAVAVTGVAGVAWLSFRRAEALVRELAPLSDPEAIARALESHWSGLWMALLPTLLVLGVVIPLVVRVLVWPVEPLTRFAREIVAGRERVDPPGGSGADEFGEVAEALRVEHERLIQARFALREQTLFLEERVRERTRELSEARDQALAASRAKSEFLSTMSHEIRTPMNVVLGMLELLREAPMDHDRLEQVRLAYGSGKTLLALIDNVLDFSKIEADHLVLDEMEFDLRALVDESALTLATLAHTKEIELTPFFPHGMPTAVRGDVNRLRQIFTNLLGNAIKFTPEGGTVELHGGPVGGEPGEKTEYLFEIRDTGPGVPPEERERIFERFAQVESLRSQGYSGTGLGLAISRRLVEMMDGEIGVDDNPHAPSGSVFYFTVKLTQQLSDFEPDAERGAFEGLRVLGVEIDGLQRLFLEDVFSLFGARFDLVSEVETALGLLREARSAGDPFALVVLNQKPGGDGRRVCGWLRNAEPGTRFLLLTDLLDQGWDQASGLPGVSLCLKKPVSAERLHTAIDWVLQASENEPRPQPVLAARSELKNSVRYDARILLVDDHAANLTVARGMLSRLGCDPARVITATDGREGLARFREGGIGLVLMDCQMPGMNGYEASRRIRELEGELSAQRAPIVAFTANVTAENRREGELAGMDGFLAKPVTLLELQEVLERFLTPVAPLASPVAVEGGEGDMARLFEAMESIGLPEEDFREVAALLATQIPELLDSLERNIRDAESEPARATAHVLKGSMANTIFPQLQPHTRQLHDRIKHKAWQEAEGSLREVRNRFEPVERSLRLFLERGGESRNAA